MEYKPLSSLVKKISGKKEPSQPIPHFPKGYKPKEEVMEEYDEGQPLQEEEEQEMEGQYQQGYQQEQARKGRPPLDGRPPQQNVPFNTRPSFPPRPQQQQQVRQSGSTYELVEVPTQTSVMIRNNATGEVMEINQVLVELLNRQVEIDRSLRG